MTTDQGASFLNQPFRPNLTNPYAQSPYANTVVSSDRRQDTTARGHAASEHSRDNEKAAATVTSRSHDEHKTGRGGFEAVHNVERDTSLEGSVQTKWPPLNGDAVALDGKQAWRGPALDTTAFSSSPPQVRSHHSGRTNPFVQCFLGLPGAELKVPLRGRKAFVGDSPSNDLQAFIVEHGDIRPIPFGHQNLEYNLTRTIKSQKMSPWTQYLNADSETQALLAKVTDSAKRTTNRSVTLVAFHRLERRGRSDALVVFFSVKDPLRPIQLIDDIGRKFMVPYWASHTYEVSPGRGVYQRG